jgi:hypothetical protein
LSGKEKFVMKRLIPLVLACAVLWSFPAFGAPLKVAQGVITTKVDHRAPVDTVKTYSATAGRLFCFTRITGATEDTTITQVWYRNGKEMARVVLPVRSSDWRTWSSKRILPQWTGNWKVEVLDADGNLLATIPFTLI